jgi:hypothetical protein
MASTVLVIVRFTQRAGVLGYSRRGDSFNLRCLGLKNPTLSAG